MLVDFQWTRLMVGQRICQRYNLFSMVLFACAYLFRGFSILILPLAITPLSCDTNFFPQLWILLFHSTKISAVLLNWRRSRFTFLHEKEGTSLELLFNKKKLPFSIKNFLDVNCHSFSASDYQWRKGMTCTR